MGTKLETAETDKAFPTAAQGLLLLGEITQHLPRSQKVMDANARAIVRALDHEWIW